MATKYIVNNVTGQTINGESILPKYKVYTALLTQSGADSQLSTSTGLLTIGVTYFINDTVIDMDFTNVGAPNNNVGTYFVATGTNPNWGTNPLGFAILNYNEGAPVVTVLENTIGNIWFTYVQDGLYAANSNGLFTLNKTTSNIGQDPNFDPLGNPVPMSQISGDGSSNIFYVYSFYIQPGGTGLCQNNMLLVGTPIEIRVYN